MNPYERRYPPHIEEQLRADAKRCRNLRNQIGVAARPAQQEAYERWAAVMDDEPETPQSSELEQRGSWRRQIGRIAAMIGGVVLLVGTARAIPPVWEAVKEAAAALEKRVAALANRVGVISPDIFTVHLSPPPANVGCQIVPAWADMISFEFESRDIRAVDLDHAVVSFGPLSLPTDVAELPQMPIDVRRPRSGFASVLVRRSSLEQPFEKPSDYPACNNPNPTAERLDNLLPGLRGLPKCTYYFSFAGVRGLMMTAIVVSKLNEHTQICSLWQELPSQQSSLTPTPRPTPTASRPVLSTETQESMISTPPPPVVTPEWTTTIEAYSFIDANANGQCDPDEIPFANQKVCADRLVFYEKYSMGKQQPDVVMLEPRGCQITNSDGHAIWIDIPPGQYLITLQTEAPNVGSHATVTLKANERLTIMLPSTTVAKLSATGSPP
ncbi:MAG: hypothetical protein ACHQ9S_22480 [Candidatus Binatia bacterium]